MKSLPLVVLIALAIIWSFVSIDWFVCQIKGECQPKIETSQVVPDIEPVIEAQKEEVESFEKIYFSKNSNLPKFNASLETAYYPVEIMTQESATPKSFTIIGRAFANEDKGIALKRAQSAKELFRSYNWFDSIKLETEILQSDIEIEKYGKYFQATKFVVSDPQDSFKIENQIIYFGVGQTDPNKSITVVNFLKEQAERLKKDSSVSLKIVGHTDSDGDAGANKRLGLKRAQTIADKIQSFGVESNRLVVKSFGEEQPTADNSTSEGKNKNRRVELIDL